MYIHVAVGVTIGKTLSNEGHKQAVITHFAAIEFDEMSDVLDELRDTMLKHPMHPAFNVSSRPPTDEEVFRAPLKPTYKYAREEDCYEGSLLANPELFQLGVPFNVEYSPFTSGDRDDDASYSGELNFSLFGLPGKCTTHPQRNRERERERERERVCTQHTPPQQARTKCCPFWSDISMPCSNISLNHGNTSDIFAVIGAIKQAYKARVLKWGGTCIDSFSLEVRFNDFDTTFVSLEGKDDDVDVDRLLRDPEGPNESELRLKFKEMGLSERQSSVGMDELCQRLGYAFEESGIHYCPCEQYFCP